MDTEPGEVELTEPPDTDEPPDEAPRDPPSPTEPAEEGFTLVEDGADPDGAAPPVDELSSSAASPLGDEPGDELVEDCDDPDDEDGAGGAPPATSPQPPLEEGTHSTSPGFAVATIRGSSAALTVRVHAGVVPAEDDEPASVLAGEEPPDGLMAPGELVVPLAGGTSDPFAEAAAEPGSALLDSGAEPPPPMEPPAPGPDPVATPGVTCGPSVDAPAGGFSDTLGAGGAPAAAPAVEDSPSPVEPDEPEPEPDSSPSFESESSFEPESPPDPSSELEPPVESELPVDPEPEPESAESESEESESEESESPSESSFDELLLMTGPSSCWDARSATTVRCRSTGSIAETLQNAVTAVAVTAVPTPTPRNTRQRCCG